MYNKQGNTPTYNECIPNQIQPPATCKKGQICSRADISRLVWYLYSYVLRYVLQIGVECEQLTDCGGSTWKVALRSRPEVSTDG